MAIGVTYGFWRSQKCKKSEVISAKKEMIRIEFTVTYRYFNSITTRTSIKQGVDTSRHEKVTGIKTPCQGR